MTGFFHGEQAGSTDAVQITRDVDFNTGYIKAKRANTGNVYIGSSSDVGVTTTTDTNTTCGFELDAGEVLPLDYAGNLNQLWYICDNAGDGFCYWLARWATT